MNLNDLEVYKLSREIGKDAWGIYNGFDWKTKKILGDQFIRAVDSIATNIAEGFGRFHYLDRNKFNYNARGSLLESIHWTELLQERLHISDEEYVVLNKKFKNLMVKLNNYIVATKALKK